MSKYIWDITLDKYDKDISLGINFGASWYYKGIRMSFSFMRHTLHLGIDRNWENV